MPAPTAKPDRLFAGVPSFSKYQETFHAIDDREKTDCSHAADLSTVLVSSAGAGPSARLFLRRLGVCLYDN